MTAGPAHHGRAPLVDVAKPEEERADDLPWSRSPVCCSIANVDVLLERPSCARLRMHDGDRSLEEADSVCIENPLRRVLEERLRDQLDEGIVVERTRLAEAM